MLGDGMFPAEALESKADLPRPLRAIENQGDLEQLLVAEAFLSRLVRPPFEIRRQAFWRRLAVVRAASASRCRSTDCSPRKSNTSAGPTIAST
jgi:hypothetical protein